MLRVTVHRDAQSAAAYYTTGLARADYYTTAPLPGVWQGAGAALLGLDGPVTPAQFLALCENHHPVTGARLTPRTKRNRRAGYDCTFNAPKSLTLLYEYTRDARLLQAFDDAVQATMQAIEQAMHTRVRQEGTNTERATGTLVAARFTDFFARPVADGSCDPHLHCHVFVMNATWDPVEKRWKAGEFAPILRDRAYFEALFHAQCAHAVRALGYDTLRVGKFWEIAGIAPALRQKFSQRTRIVEETARALGITDPAVKDRLGATTRQRKGHGTTLAALRTAWQARLTPADRQELAQAAQAPPAGPACTPAQALAYALTHGLERLSTLRETGLLEQALRYGVGHVTLVTLRQALALHPGVLRGIWQGHTLLTTQEVYAEEQALLGVVQATRGTCPPFRDPATPWAPGARDHAVPLHEDQIAAVRHVLASRDGVIAIRGGAGTGKTTLMRAAVAALEASSGSPVVVCAPHVDGVAVLRQEGFTDAATVQRLLVSPTLQARLAGQVLWVDEAGLLAVPTLRALLALAARQQARVILCGDTGQHSAVERGDALRLLEDHAGLQPAEVRTIVRQQGVYRQTVQAFQEGRVDEGWEHLASMGAVVEIADTPARLDRLARDFCHLTTPTPQAPCPTALVVAPTHAEGDHLTGVLRTHLGAQGRLGSTAHPVHRLRSLHWTRAERQDGLRYLPGLVVQCTQALAGWQRSARLTVATVARDGVWVQDAQGIIHPLPLAQASHFEVYAADTIDLAMGDTIRLTANGSARDGTRLTNGALHTVAGVTPEGQIQLGDGRILAPAYGHLTYGYVVTSHAAQGKTVDHVLIAESTLSFPAASREQWYVSLSRGRHSVRVYTDDATALRRAVCPSGQRLCATTLLHQDTDPAPDGPRIESEKAQVPASVPPGTRTRLTGVWRWATGATTPSRQVWAAGPWSLRAWWAGVARLSPPDGAFQDAKTPQRDRRRRWSYDSGLHADARHTGPTDDRKVHRPPTSPQAPHGPGGPGCPRP